MTTPHYLRFAQALALLTGVSGCFQTTVVVGEGDGSVRRDGGVPVDGPGPIPDGGLCTNVRCPPLGPGCVRRPYAADCCHAECPIFPSDAAVVTPIDVGDRCAEVDCEPPPPGCAEDPSTPDCCDWVCDVCNIECPTPPAGCTYNLETPTCCDVFCPMVTCGECSCWGSGDLGFDGGPGYDGGPPSCEAVGRGSCCLGVGPLWPPDVAV